MSEVNQVKGTATNLAGGHTLPKCRDHFPQPGGRPSKRGFVERPTKVTVGVDTTEAPKHSDQ